MTYEDNKKKRSTLPVVDSVRAIASDLCFLDDFQLRTLVFVDGKVLWFFKKSNNSKTKTMETTKEEMMQFLRELQDLQQWLSTNSLYEISLNVDFNIFEDSIVINCYTCLFSNFDEKGKSVWLDNFKSCEENRKQLNYFIEYVKKLSKYGTRKSESNQTPTGKARV